MTARRVWLTSAAIVVIAGCSLQAASSEAPAAPAGGSGAAATVQAAGQQERRSKVSQWGITWTFAEPARAGRFVTGDWWVVGPVTVKSIDPAPTDGRHGSVVNPPAGERQGYDIRLDPPRPKTYDPTLRAALPLALKPGDSLVSTISAEKQGSGNRTPETVKGQYCRGPIQTAAVLTCVAAPMPADAFRPPYVGTEKLPFRASQLRRDLLPRVKPVGKLPDVALYERYLQRIWLDHFPGWRNRAMHPWENMPDYGREITNIVSTLSLMLTVDDPEKKHETLLLKFVQLGIDYYGTALSHPGLWSGDGGHNSGRKMPILFAGVLLDHEGMKHVKAAFAEDQQTYHGDGWRGQKALWKISAGDGRKHEHLPPEKWDGPPFKGANNGWKSEGYRGLNGPTWVGEALAARLLGARGHWNHDAFFDYVDRWVAEEADGMVNRKTMERRGYRAAEPGFIRPMWDTYRAKADEIGAGVLRKAEAAKPVE